MKGKQSKTKGNLSVGKTADYSPFLYLLFAFYAFLFVSTPHSRGLFFYQDYFMVSFFLQLLFLATCAVLFKQLKGFLVDNFWLLLVALGMPMVYCLAYFSSVSPYLAANETLKWVSYVLVFFMLLLWIKSAEQIKDWLYGLNWITILWIVIFVYLNDFGLVEYKDAIVWGRFTSVFQYPNTFASIVSAFLLAGLMGLAKQEEQRAWYWKALYAVSILPFFVAFLFTDSRGGLLVFALGWVVALFFLHRKEQLVYLAYSFIAGLMTLLVYIGYERLASADRHGLAGLVLALATALFGLLVWLWEKKASSLLADKINAANEKSIWLIPGVVLALGIAGVMVLGTTLRQVVVSILPTSLAERVATISLAQHSVQERLLFYKDSFAVWQDYFFLGAGGGAWRSLFESYKSIPYHSTQAHSFYMQTLVEVGLLGAVIVFSFFAWVILKGIRVYFQTVLRSVSVGSLLPFTLVISVVLMMHNAIDFNMSYGTYNLFLFTLLAIIWHEASSSKRVLAEKQPSDELTVSKGQKSNFLLDKLPVKQRELVAYVLLGVLVITSCLNAYQAYAFGRAEDALQATASGGDVEQALGQLEQGISFNKNNASLYATKVNVLLFVYQQTNDQQILEEIEENFQYMLAVDSYRFENYLQYGKFLWDHQRYTDSFQQLSKALTLAPWREDVYSTSIQLRVEFLQNHLAKNDEESERVRKELQQVLAQLEDKLAIQQGELPKGLELTNPIRLTPEFQALVDMAKQILQEG